MALEVPYSMILAV